MILLFSKSKVINIVINICSERPRGLGDVFSTRVSLGLPTHSQNKNKKVYCTCLPTYLPVCLDRQRQRMVRVDVQSEYHFAIHGMQTVNIKHFIFHLIEVIYVPGGALRNVSGCGCTWCGCAALFMKPNLRSYPPPCVTWNHHQRTWFLIPYFRPDPKIGTLFQTSKISACF